MAKFYDLFSNYSPGDLLAQNPDYVLGATETIGTAVINSNGELVFTNGTGWGAGENLFYTGLSATTELDVYAQIHNGQARVGVAGSNLVDMTAINFGSYSTSRVNDSNTEIRRTVGTSSTTLVNRFSTQAGIGVFSKMRLNLSPAEGDILVRYKYWIATNPEPELWDVEYVDTSSVRVTDALIGAIHLRSGPGSSFRVIDWGVGTDGDVAPKEAIPNENATVTSDTELVFNIQQALTAELELNYDLRESLQADLQSTWNMLNGIHMDVAATWSIIQNLTADLQADWQIVQNVDKDVYLPWSIESAIQTAIKDLTASWQIRHAVVASLNTQWQLLAALEIDMQSRWNIAQSIVTDLHLLFEQRETVQHDATLTWHQIAITESSITFVWKLGDTVLPPISIIKIRPETRVFRAVIH